MQTFLPYSSFEKSAKSLDYRRLGKQRVEAKQILNVLSGKTSAWINHPAVKMWRGYENALKLYYNTMLWEWISRGYNNNMEFEIITGDIIMPHWLGNDNVHMGYQSNLNRKDPNYYNFPVSNNLHYTWAIYNK